ncbi:hypothetical protein RQP46_006406 [Phenoliferia psychrophenolica]
MSGVPPGLSFGIGYALAVGLLSPAFQLELPASEASDASEGAAVERAAASSSSQPSSDQHSSPHATSPPLSKDGDPLERDAAALNAHQTRACWNATRRAAEDSVSQIVLGRVLDADGRVRVDYIQNESWVQDAADVRSRLADERADAYERWQELEAQRLEDEANEEEEEDEEEEEEEEDDSEEEDASDASESPCLPPTPDLAMECDQPKRLFQEILPSHAHTLQRKRRPSLDVFLDDDDGEEVDEKPFFGLSQRPFWLKAPPGDLNVTTASPTSPVPESKAAMKAIKGKGKAKRVRWAEPEDAASFAARSLGADDAAGHVGVEHDEQQEQSEGRGARTRKRTKSR